MTDITVPQLAWPLRFENGQEALVEQDSPDDLTARVYAVLAYRPGQRLDRPDFGLAQQAQRQGGASLEEIRETVQRLEPDAALLLERDPSLAGQFTA